MNPASPLRRRRRAHHLLQAGFAAATCAAAACAFPDGDEPATSETRQESRPPKGDGANEGPLVYWDGFLQYHPRLHLVFWGPKWTSDSDHRNARTKVEDTLRALAGGRYNALLMQYQHPLGEYIRNDVTVEDSVIDPSTPGSLLGLGIEPLGITPQIPDEATRMVAQHNWPLQNGVPTGQKNKFSTQVMIFPQNGSTYLLPSETCGAHVFSPDMDAAYAVVRYPRPDACRPTGDLAIDLAWYAIHEYAEMATDPHIFGVLEPPFPTVRAAGSGFHTNDGGAFATPHEISDKCEKWDLTNTTAHELEYTTVNPTNTYTVPYQWSNATNACELGVGKEFASPDAFYPFTGKHTVQGKILTHYEAPGVAALLGPPVSEQMPINDDVGLVPGHVSYFGGQVCSGGYRFEAGHPLSGGAIYEHYTVPDPHDVHGCIYQKYTSLGGPGFMGFPVQDEMAIAGGRVSYFGGPACNGGGPFGSGRAVYFSDASNAHGIWGCVYQEYIRAGGPAFLGFPITDEINVPGGRANFFNGQVCAGGATVENQTSGAGVFFSAATGAHEVRGCIFQKYMANGGSGKFGLPITAETDAPVVSPQGRVSYFAGATCPQGGAPDGSGSAVFYKDGIGAHSIQACIYRQYMTSDGGPGGHLGFPTSDQLPIADGLVSYFEGHACGAWRGLESSGSAIYSSAAGVGTVQGCIYKKYQELGGPVGIPTIATLGFPTSSEAPLPWGAVSYFFGNNCGPDRGVHNEGSAIFAGPGGIHNVQGCIYRKYRRPIILGGDGGPGDHLAWPVSDEIAIPGGWVSYFQGNNCNDGVHTQFESGSAIYATSPSNVHTVQGCIYKKYVRDHQEYSGPLGFPVTDEQRVNGGFASYFQGQLCGPETGPGGSGSGIFASGATGVHTVKGCIFTKYVRDLGGAAGRLGFPTSDEIDLPFGHVSYFAGNACGSFQGPSQSGSAIYAGPGGIHNVQGCIYKKYVDMGGPFPSGLGYPTSDEIQTDTGWISHFEHGYIRADGSSIQVFIQH